MKRRIKKHHRERKDTHAMEIYDYKESKNSIPVREPNEIKYQSRSIMSSG
jgi:hypothetical protein